MSVNNVAPVTEPAVSDDTLTALVAAVKQDSTGVVASVRVRVSASQTDTNNCMMGGWTS